MGITVIDDNLGPVSQMEIVYIGNVIPHVKSRYKSNNFPIKLKVLEKFRKRDIHIHIWLSHLQVILLDHPQMPTGLGSAHGLHDGCLQRKQWPLHDLCLGEM